MRLSTRALVSVVIVACCSQQLAAAESSPRWWPFGHKDESVKQPTAIGAASPPMQTNLPPIATAPTSKTLTVAPPAESPLAVAPPPATGAIAPRATTSAQPPVAGPTTHEAQLPSTTAEAETKERWMFKSHKGKISWPHLNKPSSKGGSVFGSNEKAETPRNTWVEKTPAPPKPSPMKPLTDGAHKVSASTKSAWNKTVDALTPGEPKPKAPAKTTPRIAKRESEPSVWQKMFGANSEPQQPKTVPEWMAQKRLDP